MSLFSRRPSFQEGLETFQKTPGAVLLDVRTPEEFAAGHVPEAVNATLWSVSITSRTRRCLSIATAARAAGGHVFCWRRRDIMPLISAGSQNIPAGLTADPIFCFRNSETLENFRFLVYDELRSCTNGRRTCLGGKFPVRIGWEKLEIRQDSHVFLPCRIKNFSEDPCVFPIGTLLIRKQKGNASGPV